ncbi:MAG: hypothetical protein ABSB73_09640 [Solirubrobacteraceae bacterium]|jgi:hypothetical protein
MTRPDDHATRLSLDVGGEQPSTATLKISAALGLANELAKGDRVAIRIIGFDGQILAEGDARIIAVTFRDHFDEYGNVAFVKRAHTAKVSQ